MASEGKAGVKSLAYNRRAKFEYELVERYEAGIVLTGAEVKSIREGQVTIGESYIRPINGEIFWVNGHITPYKHLSLAVDPLRSRKLLLHQSEIEKLVSKVERRGFTMVPVELYLKGGRIKMEIALARGKEGRDKREVIKSREAAREAQKIAKRLVR